MAARDAAATPLPKEDTTPPVTNTYLVICQSFRKSIKPTVDFSNRKK